MLGSAVKKTKVVSTLAVATAVALLSSTPARANHIDTPPTGVTVNQSGPNYDVTIDCDNLPYSGGELYTGATQRGTYTLHFEANCQNSSNYKMQVDDNGDTAEVGGYKVNGVSRATSSGYIPIPATMTLKPDTFVTLMKQSNSDFFNVRYNGSDPNQTSPEPTTNTEELSNTGVDSELYLVMAGGLVSIGLGSLMTARAIKRRKSN